MHRDQKNVFHGGGGFGGKVGLNFFGRRGRTAARYCEIGSYQETIGQESEWLKYKFLIYDSKLWWFLL